MIDCDVTNTLNRLAAMLAKDSRLTLDHLAPDATLESLGIDSLGMVELLWNVEEEFGITLPRKTVELLTVGDVVRYIDALVAEQGAGSTRAVPAAPPVGQPVAPSRPT